MKKMNVTIGILLSMLMFSSGAMAETVSALKKTEKPLNIRSPHCYKNWADGIYIRVEGLLGSVKQMVTPGSSGVYKHKFSKSGKMTSIEYKSDYGSSLDIYNYDSEGRISTINATDESGSSIGKFEYPYDDTVIETTLHSNNRGWRTEVSKHQKNSNGDSVCIYSVATNEGGLHSVKKSTTYQNGNYFEQNLNLAGISKWPFTSNYKKRLNSQSEGLTLIADTINYANGLTGTIEECSEIGKFFCHLDEKTNDGNFDKHIKQQINNNKMSTTSISWTDKNGNEVEFVRAFDNKLSDGNFPHHFYIYKYDNHGNWIERKSTVQFETPDGIKLKEERPTVVREIEYYL